MVCHDPPPGAHGSKIGGSVADTAHSIPDSAPAAAHGAAHARAPARPRTSTITSVGVLGVLVHKPTAAAVTTASAAIVGPPAIAGRLLVLSTVRIRAVVIVVARSTFPVGVAAPSVVVFIGVPVGVTVGISATRIPNPPTSLRSLRSLRSRHTLRSRRTLRSRHDLRSHGSKTWLESVDELAVARTYDEPVPT